MKTKTPSIKTVILSVPNQQMIRKCLRVYIFHYFTSLGIDDVKFPSKSYYKSDSSDLIMKVHKTTIIHYTLFRYRLKRAPQKKPFLLQQI